MNMKRLITILICFIFLQIQSFAGQMKVVALNDFTTLDNEAKIKIYVAEDYYLNTKLLIPEGSVFVGSIADIKEPKRLKRNADFDFVAFYYMDAQKYKYRIETPIVGNYSTTAKLDKNNSGKKVAFAVTDKIAAGSGHVRNAHNGAKQRKQGRIKGAMTNLYQHSILSWKDKGTHLNIKKGDCFYINFPMYNQNEYSFEKVFTQIDNYGNPLIEKKKNQLKPQGSELEPNYPYKHQYNSRIFYLAHPKKEKTQ